MKSLCILLSIIFGTNTIFISIYLALSLVVLERKLKSAFTRIFSLSCRYLALIFSFVRLVALLSC